MVRPRLSRAGIALAALIGTTGMAAPEPTGCQTPQHRQLDFRIGVFDVETASGIRAGVSIVDTDLGGCLLREKWIGAVSGEGRATFFYDSAARLWRMNYVTDDGNSLMLTGAFRGDALVMNGENLTFDGRRGMHRMTWSPLPHGGVRQLWEFSPKAGRWEVLFDGRHARR